MKLIVFSGLDGAGKSTQISYLIESLAKKGLKTKYLWVRGGYNGPLNSLKVFLKKCFGPKIIPSGRTRSREKVFESIAVQKTFIVMAILDLIFVYCIYLRLLFFFNIVVIADRYLIDTKIDFVLNYPKVHFTKWRLWKLLNLLIPIPDKHLLLIISIEESVRRSKLKKEPFPDDENYLARRLDCYLKFSQNRNIEIVDCSKNIESIKSLIGNKIKYNH